MHEHHVPESFGRKIRVRRFLVTVYRDHVLFLASALSFDALLAAIPLALLVLAILGVEDLRSVIEVVMPTGAGQEKTRAEHGARRDDIDVE